MLCNDKITRLGLIRGKMRKRNWVNMGSIVLYSTRDYEKDKVDIIHVYSNNVLKMLENRMNLNFNVSDEDEIDNIFTTNDLFTDDIIEQIPEKQKVTNEYFNFSDSEEETEEEHNNNIVINDKFIDDL